MEKLALIDLNFNGITVVIHAANFFLIIHQPRLTLLTEEVAPVDCCLLVNARLMHHIFLGHVSLPTVNDNHHLLQRKVTS